VRIAVCDYSGHPFQVQLSRELARRAHDVLHLTFAGFQTPKGALQWAPGDSPSLEIDAINLASPFAKHSYVKRWKQERALGNLFVRRLQRFQPDVILGANFPLDTLSRVAKWASAENRAFVLWQQDIYSKAITAIFAKRFGFAGRLIGSWYRHIERSVMRTSDATVVIDDSFKEAIRCEFRLGTAEVHVIENWAPLNEITVQPKNNTWSRAQGLAHTPVVLYTGTLGLKHNPGLLLRLAESLRNDPAVQIVVTSEGPGADWLAEQSKTKGLANIRVLPFQPYHLYPAVLGTADVVVAMLEADAGSFSVPSKILSYMAGGKAIALCAPQENLATRLVAVNGTGITVPPDDADAFCAAVTTLLSDDARRADASRASRAYAERAFDLGAIADRFEQILLRAQTQKSSQRRYGRKWAAHAQQA